MKAKKLLDKTSLSETIDNVNEAYFFGYDISASYANEAVSWILKTYDTKYSYNHSFGLTDKDFKSKLKTFTGEPLNSPASLRHINAEEASRALNILKKYSSVKMPELKMNDERFLKMLKASESNGKPAGTFCCGPCTVSLWRNLSAGGLGSYAKNLNKGFSVLKFYRKEKGQWSRFPFYYTLSALYESRKLPNAKKELEYAYDECKKKLIRLKVDNIYSERRHELLRRILDL